MKYRRNDVGVCPNCFEEGGLDYRLVDFEDDQLVYPYKCEKCGFVGYEAYNVQFSTHYDKDKNAFGEPEFGKSHKEKNP